MANNFSNFRKKQPSILIIAGSDPLGYAGIGRDISTLTQLNSHAFIAISAITVQNDQNLANFLVTEPSLFKEQCLTILQEQDIKAIKIGMIGHRRNIEILADLLALYPNIPVILDPVLYASSGGKLFLDEKDNGHASFETIFLTKLVPLCTLLTPNLEELSLLTQMDRAKNAKEGLYGAKKLQTLYQAQNILIKGGHSQNFDPNEGVEDILLSKDATIKKFSSPFVRTTMRGTGCLLASAIAAFMAHHYSLAEAIYCAKGFLYQKLKEKMLLTL